MSDIIPGDTVYRFLSRTDIVVGKVIETREIFKNLLEIRIKFSDGSSGWHVAAKFKQIKE